MGDRKIGKDGFVEVAPLTDSEPKPKFQGYRCGLCNEEFKKGYDHGFSCDRKGCPMGTVNLAMA